MVACLFSALGSGATPRLRFAPFHWATRSVALQILDEAWLALERGTITYPLFVLAFESAVQKVEEGDDPVAESIRRIWGQVEIINAICLDEGVAPSIADIADTAELVWKAHLACI